MRTSILTAALLGMFAAACTGSIDDVGGGGDDTGGGADCGNGVVDTGEACDDGNTLSGDGCSASCATEQQANPRVTAAVDKTTVMTELKSTNMVTVTVTGVDGFSGAVNLTAKAVDATNAPITGWTVALDTQSVTLTENGTATAVVTLTIPSDSRTLSGSVVVDATSSAGTESVTSAVTAAKQVTLDVTVTNNDCVYPGNVSVVSGTVVRFNNKNTVNFVIHSDGGALGVPHQGPGGGQSPDDPVTEPNTAYARTTTASGAFGWYCHDLGPDLGAGNPRITVMAP